MKTNRTPEQVRKALLKDMLQKSRELESLGLNRTDAQVANMLNGGAPMPKVPTDLSKASEYELRQECARLSMLLYGARLVRTAMERLQ